MNINIHCQKLIGNWQSELHQNIKIKKPYTLKLNNITFKKSEYLFKTIFMELSVKITTYQKDQKYDPN